MRNICERNWRGPPGVQSVFGCGTGQKAPSG